MELWCVSTLVQGEELLAVLEWLHFLQFRMQYIMVTLCTVLSICRLSEGFVGLPIQDLPPILP